MSGNKIILCVDDESSILRMMQRLLSREGYEVYTALSGETALEILEEQHVDVIVTDQRMPGMSGWQFLREARQRHPQAIRIMMSGYSDLNSTASAVDNGDIFRFIEKPWRNSHFLEVLELALAQ
jgi:DNA-binding NtrC family response regulator